MVKFAVAVSPNTGKGERSGKGSAANTVEGCGAVRRKGGQRQRSGRLYGQLGFHVGGLRARAEQNQGKGR